MGSTLTARDANAGAVNSQDGDRFITPYKATKAKHQSDKYRKSKVYRNIKKSLKEHVGPQVRGRRRRQEDPTVEVIEEVVEDGRDVEDIVEHLPSGVLNIEIDEGLYEYSRELYEYLKESEKAYVIPQDFLDTGSITVNRRMLVDWLIQVQHHLKLTQESLYLTVSILDTILNRREVDADKLQLLGITAMLLATKFEEYYPAKVGKLIQLTENSYTREQVLEMERMLIQILGFKIYIPSPQVFLLRYTRAALRSIDDLFYDTCNYIMDCHLLLPNHSCVPASQSAAASVLLASLLYHVSDNDSTEDDALAVSAETIWTPTLVHFSSYSYVDLVQISLEMLNQMILVPEETYRYRGVFNKYTSNSQHKKLALLPHVQMKVLEKARSVLIKWKWSNHYCSVLIQRGTFLKQ